MDINIDRKTLHHKDDYFIRYMNGNYYSAQWLHNVDEGNDYYDPHWREEIPRTDYNIFCYRYFGKLPWVKWHNHIISTVLTGFPLIVVRLISRIKVLQR